MIPHLGHQKNSGDKMEKEVKDIDGPGEDAFFKYNQFLDYMGHVLIFSPEFSFWDDKISSWLANNLVFLALLRIAHRYDKPKSGRVR